MRTTVNIDDPVLKELKKLQKERGKSLGRLISDLLAQALRERKQADKRPRARRWISRRMGARMDPADKEALYAALDRKAPADEEEDRP